MKFQDIPNEPTAEWALTVNANDLNANKSTYDDYLAELRKITDDLKYYYEKGSKDKRLHIHCYVLLKKAKTKYAMNKIFKRPKGWSIDFSHVYDKDGWMNHITKDDGEVYNFDTYQEQEDFERSMEPPFLNMNQIKKQRETEKRLKDEAMFALITSLEDLFPNALLPNIFTEKYSTIIENYFTNI